MKTFHWKLISFGWANCDKTFCGVYWVVPKLLWRILSLTSCRTIYFRIHFWICFRIYYWTSNFANSITLQSLRLSVEHLRHMQGASKAHEFRRLPDTSKLKHTLLIWGSKCLSIISGMERPLSSLLNKQPKLRSHSILFTSILLDLIRFHLFRFKAFPTSLVERCPSDETKPVNDLFTSEILYNSIRSNLDRGYSRLASSVDFCRFPRICQEAVCNSLTGFTSLFIRSPAPWAVNYRASNSLFIGHLDRWKIASLPRPLKSDL